MTSNDLKAVGELVKAVGPTDEHRQKFGQTFLGTLLGQATVLVGMVMAYFAALILINKYAIDDLREMRVAFGDVLFWAVVTVPLACILLFSMLPTLWRALRERRLKAAIISGDPQFKAGYFRLYPYAQADREAFKRLDGADVKILNWLRSTKASLLYLSGASGVGKSSLLAAEVLPKLRDGGWTVMETRLFGDPVSLRAFLGKAAEARTRKDLAPFLVTIDQFEEFLILHGEDERAIFADFLSDLANNPIDDMRLLLVFRSDYRPLVFKLNLPPLVAGENWQELAPYDRGEATSFLQGGGRVLSPETLGALFRGLDRIEETRGIYRPITLNMVGLVLERMGPTLEGDPAHLIQRYLRDCLTASLSRDFAKPLLSKMITDAGTKEPRSEADLAKLTRFEQWQVKATLADLSEPGLVRRLQGAEPVWEIAHDFLARTIGQLIGRLKPTLIERALPLIAPAVLFGWIAIFAALPNWQISQQRAVERNLQHLGASIEVADLEGVAVRFPSMSDDKLSAVSPLLARLNELRSIYFHGSHNITSLEPLKKVTNLSSLFLDEAGGVVSLEPLKGLTNLSSLTLHEAGSITTLEPLKGLKNLTYLQLDGLSGINSLEPLRGLTNLSDLILIGAYPSPGGIAQTLQGETIELSPVVAFGITSLEPLKGLQKLSSLTLRQAPGLTSLEPLKGLAKLSEVTLTDTGVTSLEPLKGKKITFQASPELLKTFTQ